MANLIVRQKGCSAKKVSTFMDWNGAVDCGFESTSRKTSKLSDDRLVSMGLKDPLGFYEEGSSELAALAECITPTGEVDYSMRRGGLEDEALQKPRLALMCSAKIRCMKFAATLFHGAVVYAVDSSIKQVDASRAAAKSIATRARFN